MGREGGESAPAARGLPTALLFLHATPPLSLTHTHTAADDDAPVESLFAAELARRAAGGPVPSESVPPAPAWASSDDPDAPLPPPQLAASRALVNEGLSGLIPRARALLTLGFSFSAAFAGLAALAAGAFALLAVSFGPAFVHGGSPDAGPPPYVDPYTLIDRRGLLGTDGPDGPLPPPPPGYKKARAEAAAAQREREQQEAAEGGR
jgi:hypothetical protein